MRYAHFSSAKPMEHAGDSGLPCSASRAAHFHTSAPAELAPQTIVATWSSVSPMIFKKQGL